MENKQYHNQLRCNIYIYIYIIKADIDNKNTHTRNIKFKRRIQINKKNTSYILLNKRNNARRRSPHVQKVPKLNTINIIISNVTIA